MNVLFFAAQKPDYLQDHVLLGLRSLYGSKAVDSPKKKVMYSNCPTPNHKIYGNGFTTWKLLPDEPIDRTRIFSRIRRREFDLIVFGSIWRMKRMYWLVDQYCQWNRLDVPIWAVDGEDAPRLYEPALKCSRYFKRELIGNEIHPVVHPVSFGMPEQKLREHAIPKQKLFATHAQCEEAYKLAEVRESCQAKYAFTDESEYYKDIAQSSYAITMKKSGWDCMRHYEIAGNWTVPCFYKLDEKPSTCAPHGLIDMENVIGFNTAEELRAKIDAVEARGTYPQLQVNAFQWAQQNSCREVVQRMFTARQRSMEMTTSRAA